MRDSLHDRVDDWGSTWYQKYSMKCIERCPKAKKGLPQIYYAASGNSDFPGMSPEQPRQVPGWLRIQSLLEELSLLASSRQLNMHQRYAAAGAPKLTMLATHSGWSMYGLRLPCHLAWIALLRALSLLSTGSRACHSRITASIQGAR